MTESALHFAAAEFLHLALPPEIAWHHSPNEGKRGKQAQRELKRTGVRAGWPDLELIYEARAYFIELKTLAGRLSPEQEAAHDALARAGAQVAVCRSVGEVEATLRRWGVPLRARLAA